MCKREIEEKREIRTITNECSPFLDEEAGSHEGPRVQRLRGEGRLQCEAVHRLQGQGGQDPDNPGGEDPRW